MQPSLQQQFNAIVDRAVNGGARIERDFGYQIILNDNDTIVEYYHSYTLSAVEIRRPDQINGGWISLVKIYLTGDGYTKTGKFTDCTCAYPDHGHTIHCDVVANDVLEGYRNHCEMMDIPFRV